MYIHTMNISYVVHTCTHIHAHGSTFFVLKLIAFELAANFSRRRENPVQPRLSNAKNAIFKRLKTGFSLRSRFSPANSNAISFTWKYFVRSTYDEYFVCSIHMNKYFASSTYDEYFVCSTYE